MQKVLGHYNPSKAQEAVLYPVNTPDDRHRPLTIRYDHQIFTAQRWGGVSRYFTELARELGRTNAVSVHAPLYVTEYLSTLSGGAVRGVRLPAFPGVTLLANGVARCSRSRRECGIYHPTWYHETGWRPRKAKVTYTVFDMIAELFEAENPAFPQQASAKKRAVAEADLIFCISESTKSDLVRILGVPPERVAVTYLGSNIHLLPPQKAPISYPYILYVGQRGGYKNFLSLARAFKSSARLRRDFGLVCFGGGAFNSLELEILGDMLGDGCGTVRRLEGTDEELAGAYREAAVFVCPSLYEGFGLPVLEAMACACPVVATNVSSLSEVGGSAVAYTADGSPDAIRQALEGLLFDETAIPLARASGLKQANSFGWSSTAAATLAGYLSLLE